MNIRLYHPNSIAENTTIILSKDHTHYVVRVMRLKLGSNVNFFNKNGEWESKITILKKDKVEVKFLKKVRMASNLSKVQLAICLVKRNPMEMILQKATELGVGKIIPIVSERTEVKELNHERAKKIVIEATEQCNQLEPPEILKVTTLKNFIQNLDKNARLLFADVNSKNRLETYRLKSSKFLSVLIGPEGDFSSNERQNILSNPQTIPFTLSNNILRSETAVISALSLINHSII